MYFRTLFGLGDSKIERRKRSRTFERYQNVEETREYTGKQEDTSEKGKETVEKETEQSKETERNYSMSPRLYHPLLDNNTSS